MRPLLSAQLIHNEGRNIFICTAVISVDHLLCLLQWVPPVHGTTDDSDVWASVNTHQLTSTSWHAYLPISITNKSEEFVLLMEVATVHDFRLTVGCSMYGIDSMLGPQGPPQPLPKLQPNAGQATNIDPPAENTDESSKPRQLVPALIHGPYLQAVGQSSARIMWRMQVLPFFFGCLGL